MGQHLELANALYQEAQAAFERGRRAGDSRAIREAAEKAWEAIVQATYEMIASHHLPLPRTPAQRRARLADLERLDPRIKELGFRDRFGAREHYLHEDCFFEGICPIDLLEEDIFQKVKDYLADVEKATPRRARSRP